MEVVYTIWRRDDLGIRRKHKVSGFQIGRFAVRDRTDDDLTAYTSSGKVVKVGKYLIDHVNTGIIVIDVNGFEDAVRIADDLSRFSLQDPSAKDPQKFFKQIGTKIIEWLTWVIQNRKVIDYREYRRSQLKGTTIWPTGTNAS